MAASYGTPTPVLRPVRFAGAPARRPTANLLVDKRPRARRLGNVKFDPTPKGVEVMAITFPAALGAMYAHLSSYQDGDRRQGLHTLHTQQHEALAEGIYNKLVTTT